VDHRLATVGLISIIVGLGLCWTQSLNELSGSIDNPSASNSNVTDMRFNNTSRPEANASARNSAASASDILVYVNRPYGISMLYPESWSASTSALRDYTQLVAFYSPLENLSDGFPSKLTISTIKYKQNVSLSDYTDVALLTINQSQQIDIRNSSEVTLAGYPGYRVVVSSKPIQNSTLTVYKMDVLTSIGNKIYLVSYDGESNNFKEHLAEANRMIGSIRIGNK